MLLGSHVGMSGNDFFLGSVKEALSYGADTFMLYTGAPQNSKRTPLEELKIPQAHKLMAENDIQRFVVHAPYIINLGNSVNEETYELGKQILISEMMRTKAMGSDVLILHPGAHVGAGPEIGIQKIVEGLDEALDQASQTMIALETMAGKGSEIGRNIDEMYEIFSKVKDNSRLRICIDTCHLNDAGYDVVNHFDEILEEIESKLGKDVIVAAHINDSMNPCGSHKDRHANIGKGTIGLDVLRYIVNHPLLSNVPKILETPYLPGEADSKKTFAPYKEEIQLLLQK